MTTFPRHVPGSATGRVLGFDVVRAVAILLVLGSHAPCLPPPDFFGYDFFVFWKRGGWMAVELFFGLSGFLITSLLLREKHLIGRTNGKAFLIRRVFKLYPPALLFLAAFGAWLWIGESGSAAERIRNVVQRLWPMLVHVQNYVPIRSAEHLWSLAVEEHFYALILIVFLLSLAASDHGMCRRLMILLPALAVLSWCGRLVYVVFFYEGVGPIGFAFTHNRVDSLIAGTLGACLVHTHGSRLLQIKAAPLLLACGAVLGTVPSFVWEIYEHRSAFLLWVLPWQALGVGCLMLFIWTCSQWARGRGQVSRAGRLLLAPVRFSAFLGRCSYSTYLWHMPFASVAVGAAERLGIFGSLAGGSLSLFCIYIAISQVMGVAFYLAIECPALMLRKKLFPDHRNNTPHAQSLPLQAAA